MLPKIQSAKNGQVAIICNFKIHKQFSLQKCDLPNGIKDPLKSINQKVHEIISDKFSDKLSDKFNY